MKNKLDISQLSKQFGNKPILKDIQLTLRQGEITGLLGANGSGKSTLLQAVFGTLKPSALTLKINDAVIAPRQIINQQKIAYLPQQSFLPNTIKVRAIIPHFYKEGHLQDQIFNARYMATLANRKIGTLSLGEKRYLEVVLIAHLNHPFLMLDEPFSMIEPRYIDAIKNTLNELKWYKGILITDHYYKDVLAITDHNFVLKNGSIFRVQNVTDLKAYGYIR